MDIEKSDREAEDTERRRKIVDTLTMRLMENFDSVQILATWIDRDGATHDIKWGAGNWHARQGMARKFIEQDSARELAHELNSGK